jgi:hypothetical protein
VRRSKRDSRRSTSAAHCRETHRCHRRIGQRLSWPVLVCQTGAMKMASRPKKERPAIFNRATVRFTLSEATSFAACHQEEPGTVLARP